MTDCPMGSCPACEYASHCPHPEVQARVMRAEVERLEDERRACSLVLDAVEVPRDLSLKERVEWLRDDALNVNIARAEAAERRVAELEGVLAEARDELQGLIDHRTDCGDPDCECILQDSNKDWSTAGVVSRCSAALASGSGEARTEVKP